MAFPSGKSGNPGGRPKEKAFTDAIRLACMEPTADGKIKLRHIAEKIVAEAMKGESWACTMIGDRLEGKPAQIIQGDADNPLSVVFKTVYEPTGD